MKRRLAALLFFSIMLFVCACKESFDQKTSANSVDYLIVEGVINTAGVTNVSLTRTLKLSDKLAVKGELKAAVQVEGETSGVFLLTEKTGGLYSVAQLNLSASQKYRLRIKLASGKVYLSDYVAIKITPAIDSISWERTPDGVEIYANAHDAKNETRFYQWNYEEDWELRSMFYSAYATEDQKPRGLSLVARSPAQMAAMFTCYRYVKSSVIPIFSTAKLTDDIVHKFPLQSIPNGSDKFEVKYSILVRQFALTKEAYEYLSLMKKNSEGGGSLFDSQPTEIKGNIHNIADPNEMVVGFVQIAPVLEKRIYIMPQQVPRWKVALSCTLADAVNHPDSLSVYFRPSDTGPFIPSDGTVFSPNNNSILRVGGATAACMDCRLRGGTNVKPTFW